MGRDKETMGFPHRSLLRVDVRHVIDHVVVTSDTSGFTSDAHITPSIKSSNLPAEVQKGKEKCLLKRLYMNKKVTIEIYFVLILRRVIGWLCLLPITVAVVNTGRIGEKAGASIMVDTPFSAG